MDSRAQVLPFHISATGAEPPAPPATQLTRNGKCEAVQQESPRISPPPWGFGVDWIVQPVPSHDSARVFVVWTEVSNRPTAMQAEGDVHVTAFIAPSLAPFRRGIDPNGQAEPSQYSANGEREAE